MNYLEQDAKKLGFGCMRLPIKGGVIDTQETSAMVDAFLKAGFHYFDTAHGYHGGKSEKAIKTCLTSRHARDSYVLTDKLSTDYFTKQEDIRPLFQSQLDACGVEYFDYYLMHAQSADIFAKFKRCRAYETALEFLQEGRIKHFGISFHDKAAVLEQILAEYPQIEVVQIQFNYLDYESPSVEGRKCYEVCHKYGKQIIVMEPCKGGHLVNMPPNISAVLQDLHGGSNASYAIRFAAGFPDILMVLSGMGSMDMLLDNISYMQDFQPLNETELAAVQKVCELFRAKSMIPCTACRYCTDGCPKQILIPDLFACMNTKRNFSDWNADYYYGSVHTIHNGKASDCIKCGKCEEICPQHLPIRQLLEDVAKEFERG